ncbi:MAG: hypothetical protein WCG75_12630, partial [Armatimonadota bacterium]
MKRHFNLVFQQKHVVENYSGYNGSTVAHRLIAYKVGFLWIILLIATTTFGKYYSIDALTFTDSHRGTNISWSSVTDADDYLIQIRTAPGGAGSLLWENQVTDAECFVPTYSAPGSSAKFVRSNFSGVEYVSVVARIYQAGVITEQSVADGQLYTFQGPIA